MTGAGLRIYSRWGWRFVMKVLRITRHEPDADRVNFLQKIFGQDVQIIDRDTEYGSDPIVAVRSLIEEIGEVAAVEAIGPFPILTKLVDGRLGVPLIRAEFARDSSGRAIVTGKDANNRDVLKFDRYVELVRVEITTRELAAS